MLWGESLCLCKCQNNEKLICFPTTEDHQRQNGSVKDKMVQFIKAREMVFYHSLEQERESE